MPDYYDELHKELSCNGGRIMALGHKDLDSEITPREVCSIVLFNTIDMFQTRLSVQGLYVLFILYKFQYALQRLGCSLVIEQ